MMESCIVACVEMIHATNIASIGLCPLNYIYTYGIVSTKRDLAHVFFKISIVLIF